MDLLALATTGVTVLAALVLSVLTQYLRYRHTKGVIENAEHTLEDRLRDLGNMMRWSSRVLEEVRAEIDARIALAEKAKQDAEEAEHLAQLNEAQRIALARLVRVEVAGEVSKGGRRSFWQGVATNFFFFVAGAGLTFLTFWLGT